VLDDEVLRRDVYPAEVLMPDGIVLSGVRAFVTSHRVLAYRETDGRRIELAAELHLTDPWSVPADRSTLHAGQLECRTPEGTAWINRGHGCGCGSPLKALGSPVPWTKRRS
jgi:hypothetical protein